MKKVMLLLLILLMATILTACSEDEDTPVLVIDKKTEILWRLSWYQTTTPEEFREEVKFVLPGVPVAAFLAVLAVVSTRESKGEETAKWVTIMLLFGVTLMFIPMLTGYSLIYSLPEDLQLSEISTRLKWQESLEHAKWPIKESLRRTFEIPRTHARWQWFLFVIWLTFLLVSLFAQSLRPMSVAIMAIVGWLLFPHFFNQQTLSYAETQTIPRELNLAEVYSINGSYAFWSTVSQWGLYLGPPFVTMMFVTPLGSIIVDRLRGDKRKEPIQNWEDSLSWQDLIALGAVATPDIPNPNDEDADEVDPNVVEGEYRDVPTYRLQSPPDEDEEEASEEAPPGPYEPPGDDFITESDMLTRDSGDSDEEDLFSPEETEDFVSPDTIDDELFELESGEPDLPVGERDYLVIPETDAEPEISQHLKSQAIDHLVDAASLVQPEIAAAAAAIEGARQVKSRLGQLTRQVRKPSSGKRQRTKKSSLARRRSPHQLSRPKKKGKQHKGRDQSSKKPSESTEKRKEEGK